MLRANREKINASMEAHPSLRRKEEREGDGDVGGSGINDPCPVT